MKISLFTTLLVFFLTCCNSDVSRYGFKTGDEVIVGGKYYGIVYRAKDAHLPHHYICVTWINGYGENQRDCVHYKFIKKIK